MKVTDNISKITLLFFVFILIGLLQVYSSSSIYALEVYGNGWYFIKKQFVFTLVASVMYLSLSRLDMKWVLIVGALVFLVSFFGVLATHIPRVGVTAGGATRWLPLAFGFRLEPGEFVKVGFGFFIFWLLRLKDQVKNFSFWWPLLIVFLVLTAALLKQPDFGTVILLTLSTLVVLFLLIESFLPFLFIGFLSVIGFVFFLFQKSYRIERLMVFLDPWKDPQGSGYQVIQSFVAFRKGGFFGEGVGMSESKFFFLPEAHTDFTLAVFAEEWGFLGVFILLSLFMYFVFSALKLSKSVVKNTHLCVLGYYFSSLFFFYVFINFSVNIGLMPTKGLPLPFLSYGGSSLLSITLIFIFFRSLEKEAIGKTKN